MFCGSNSTFHPGCCLCAGTEAVSTCGCSCAVVASSSGSGSGSRRRGGGCLPAAQICCTPPASLRSPPPPPTQRLARRPTTTTALATSKARSRWASRVRPRSREVLALLHILQMCSTRDTALHVRCLCSTLDGAGSQSQAQDLLRAPPAQPKNRSWCQHPRCLHLSYRRQTSPRPTRLQPNSRQRQRP